MALQYGTPGRDKLGRENFPRISAIGREIRRYLDGRKDAYVSVVGERKRGTSLCEVPLFVWIGSPGRTRTCDQPVTSAPVFQLGLDYLFTRLQNMQGRVSGADEALLDGFRSL